MSRELLRRVISECGSDIYPYRISNALYADILDEIAKPEVEPSYWHVVDTDGNSIYSASFKQACHDHINAAMESEVFPDLYKEAAKWVVRPLYTAPPDYEALKAERDSLKARVDGGIRFWVSKFQVGNRVWIEGNDVRHPSNATIVLDEGVTLP